MDRPVTDSIRRRTRVRTALAVIAPLLVAAIGLALLPGWLRPSLSLARLRTAIVARGAIDASISASGLVVPALERVVSSPLDARVVRVLKRPGAALRRGDAVIELDVADSTAAFERARTDLKVKENQQAQTRLSYERSLVELDSRIDVTALELETRLATFRGQEALAKDGLLSRDELRRAELAVRQSEIQLAQLKDQRASAGKTTALQLDGLALERASLDRDIAERERVLDLATTKSDRDGVLTWVVSEEGALVRRGDVLARIADLSAFRIDATAAAVHSGRIRAGLPAVVRIDDVTLDGRVTEVYPSVENGTLRFTVALSDSSDARLRPNLRADVDIVTDRKTQTLKVKRGPFADGQGTRQVFVIRDGRAVRTPVELGVASFDEIEILSGLTEGDVVVISDMRDYAHLDALTVK